MYQPDKIFPLPESLPAETVREPKVCTLEHLIMWLEKQPTRMTYCWADSGKCLWALYGEAIGYGVGSRAYDRAIEEFRNNYHGNDLSIAVSRPHTIGAALERARSALREGG